MHDVKSTCLQFLDLDFIANSACNFSLSYLSKSYEFCCNFLQYSVKYR